MKQGLKRRLSGALLAGIAVAFLKSPSNAQFVGNLSSQDPADVLRVMIATFQNCGPTQNFFLLGPLVYQVAFYQTGGMGCYPVLRQMGVLQNLTQIKSVELPAGPVTLFKADFENGTNYWEIGVSKYTQKIEWLAFRPTEYPSPNPPNPAPPNPNPPNPIDVNQGCLIYRDMCR